MTTNPEAVSALVQQITPHLSGQPPAITGAALADLLAIWLAGHMVRGNADETDKLRAELLEGHLEMVSKLVEINARRMGTWQRL